MRGDNDMRRDLCEIASEDELWKDNNKTRLTNSVKLHYLELCRFHIVSYI